MNLLRWLARKIVRDEIEDAIAVAYGEGYEDGRARGEVDGMMNLQLPPSPENDPEEIRGAYDEGFYDGLHSREDVW